MAPVDFGARTHDPATAYDSVPYVSFAYPHTHPSRIGAIARLFGMTPAAPENARVLEIGCAGGGNLFSQALLYPDAHFTGIDIAPEQIADAKHSADAMGITNIDFKAMDITQIDRDFFAGKFDYIICHGVYSWVPQNVRAAIMAVIRDCLAPQGVAQVSYNTLPGWNAVRSLRDMMIYHTNRFATPADKIKQARALLDFLSETTADDRTGYKALIDEERKMLARSNDSYVYHDHLESANTQFYFHEFVRDLMVNDLTYVGDSSLPSMFVGNLPQKAMETLKAVNDVVNQEQYMDFINNRRFRNTLVCHKNAGLNRSLQGEQIFDFHLAALVQPDPQAANNTPGEESQVYRPVGGGPTFTAKGRVMVAIMNMLTTQAPRPVAAETLVRQVQTALGLPTDEPVRAMLRENGMKLALHGCVQLELADCKAVDRVSEKPVAFALARHQAQVPDSTGATSAMHIHNKTDITANMVLAALDGTKTRDDLVQMLVNAVTDGRLKVAREGQPLTDPAVLKPEMEGIVDRMLPKLAQQCLLMA